MRFSLYGIPQLAMSTAETFLRLYLLIYFTQYIGLSGKESAYIISGSIILSTFFDPILGSFSDYIKAKKGKLTGLINLSLFFLCFTIAGLFIPHWQQNDFYLLFFLVLLYQIFYSAFTIPYLALAKTLIKNESDIINLYSWRYVWGSVGAILGVSLPFLQSYYQTKSYSPIGIAIIILTVTCAPLALALLKEKVNKTPLAQDIKISIFSELFILFRNKAFRPFYISFSILSIGLGINQTLAVYYYKFGLKLSENEINILFAVYMFFLCLFVPMWISLAKSKGKKFTLVVGLTMITLCTLAYPHLPERNLFLLYSVIVIAGIFTGVVVLLESYLSNIVDYHNYLRNKKTSSFVFGIWRITDKLSRAIGIYIAGIILDMTINASIPSYSINDAFGYCVFSFLIIALIILKAQKFDEKHHQIIIKYLENKKPHLLYKETDI